MSRVWLDVHVYVAGFGISTLDRRRGTVDNAVALAAAEDQVVFGCDVLFEEIITLVDESLTG
jgi:hypothetical protein